MTWIYSITCKTCGGKCCKALNGVCDACRLGHHNVREDTIRDVFRELENVPEAIWAEYIRPIKQKLEQRDKNG